LEAIEAKVVELFGMVGEDLPIATAALLSGCGEVVGVLAGRERVIDALYLEIEDLASREILLQAPVASDLRFLMSVLRIAPELERSHDLVMQIASRAGHVLTEDLSPRSRGSVERMGAVASGMWCQAAEAWYSRDRSAASVLDECDNEMDELHASLTAELTSGRMTVPACHARTRARADRDRQLEYGEPAARAASLQRRDPSSPSARVSGSLPHV
jgi:phosphate transport system protein